MDPRKRYHYVFHGKTDDNGCVKATLPQAIECDMDHQWEVALTDFAAPSRVRAFMAISTLYFVVEFTYTNQRMSNKMKGSFVNTSGAIWRFLIRVQVPNTNYDSVDDVCNTINLLFYNGLCSKFVDGFGCVTYSGSADQFVGVIVGKKNDTAIDEYKVEWVAYDEVVKKSITGPYVKLADDANVFTKFSASEILAWQNKDHFKLFHYDSFKNRVVLRNGDVNEISKGNTLQFRLKCTTVFVENTADMMMLGLVHPTTVLTEAEIVQRNEVFIGVLPQVLTDTHRGAGLTLLDVINEAPAYWNENAKAELPQNSELLLSGWTLYCDPEDNKGKKLYRLCAMLFIECLKPSIAAQKQFFHELMGMKSIAGGIEVDHTIGKFICYYCFGSISPFGLLFPNENTFKCRVRTFRNTFMVFSSLVEVQFVADSHLHYLRTVYLERGANKATLKPYQYRKLNARYIKEVEIVVADHEGKNLPFLPGDTVSYTLTLRPQGRGDNDEMDKIRYIQLISNGCLAKYPQNNPAEFKTDLPEPLVFDDCSEWECGVVSMQVSKTWQYLQNIADEEIITVDFRFVFRSIGIGVNKVEDYYEYPTTPKDSTKEIIAWPISTPRTIPYAYCTEPYIVMFGRDITDSNVENIVENINLIFSRNVMNYMINWLVRSDCDVKFDKSTPPIATRRNTPILPLLTIEYGSAHTKRLRITTKFRFDDNDDKIKAFFKFFYSYTNTSNYALFHTAQTSAATRDYSVSKISAVLTTIDADVFVKNTSFAKLFGFITDIAKNDVAKVGVFYEAHPKVGGWGRVNKANFVRLYGETKYLSAASVNLFSEIPFMHVMCDITENIVADSEEKPIIAVLHCDSSDNENSIVYQNTKPMFITLNRNHIRTIKIMLTGIDGRKIVFGPAGGKTELTMAIRRKKY